VGLFAQKASDSIVSFNETNLVKESQKYTFGDFFDALDLPTVLGVGFTPNGIEGPTFNSSMRLGWRHHKNYGTFVYITYDTHSNKYDSLYIQSTNIINGEGASISFKDTTIPNLSLIYSTENLVFELNRLQLINRPFLTISSGIKARQFSAIIYELNSI
jgi:hypothetical protein